MKFTWKVHKFMEKRKIPTKKKMRRWKKLNKRIAHTIKYHGSNVKKKNLIENQAGTSYFPLIKSSVCPEVQIFQASPEAGNHSILKIFRSIGFF